MTTRDRPNLYGVCTGVLIAIAGLVAIVSPSDPDVFWHLKNGEVTLASGFGTTDTYSFTARGRPWIAHEWLFDVGAHLVTTTLGFRAAVAIAGIVQALTVWLFVRLARARDASQPLTLALTAVFLVFIAPTWGVRAQLVTAPFAGAFYFILLRHRRDPSHPRRLVVLPLLMLGWVNLHASFPLGIAILSLFLVGCFGERFVYRTSPSKLPAVPLVFALAACVMVTLLNPVGIRLWTYPLPYLFSGTPDIRVIEEWRSPDFHKPLNLVFALALWLFVVVGLGRPASRARQRQFRVRLRSRFDLTDACLVLFATVMGLRYGRLMPLFGMLALPVLGASLARAWPVLSRRAERLARVPRVARRPDYVLAAVVIAGFALVVLRSPVAQLGPAPRTDSRFPCPAGAATYLEGHPGARIFNEYAWGGYLLYRLSPRSYVFIDGRADLFRDGVFDEYGAIHDLAPDYRELLARSRSDFVLVPPEMPLATALASDPAWRRVFADAVSVLYARASGT